MTTQPNCFGPRRESLLCESVSRKPYETFLIGGGLLEGSLGAERALAFNSGIIGLGGTLIDNGVGAHAGETSLAGPQGPYAGGVLINNKLNENSACQVSSPEVQ